MIIQNGTIQVKMKRPGGIDSATGFPVKPQGEGWGCPIPCQYSPVSVNLQGRYMSEHNIKASYSILIEEQPFKGEQVRLCDREGAEVGTFSVVSVERLDAVLQVKIIV